MSAPSQHARNNAAFKACIVIPYYNHGSRVLAVVDSLKNYDLPIFVVDDGSDDPCSRAAVSALESTVTVLRHQQNEGKGAALFTGLRAARDRGFSHAVAIDADGQHNAGDVGALLAEAKKNPEDIILGRPQFDESAPWERVWGRKLSTWLVWMQTRSTSVKDILCGFRVYPLHATVAIASQVRSERMGVDIEIVVRYLRAGGKVQNVPTAVTYPKDGLSHFNYLRDNVALVRLHTHLVLLSVIPAKGDTTWFDRKELGSSAGLRLLLLVYVLLGKNICYVLLRPIIFFYLLFKRNARQAVFAYRRHLKALEVPVRSPWRHAYNTFLLFGRSAVDAVRSWRGDIELKDVRWHNAKAIHKYLRDKKGAIVLTAHFGPIEASRALHRRANGLNLHVLMYLKHAMKFRSILDIVAKDAHTSVIAVETLDMGGLTSLYSKIKDGAVVGIMADRLSPNSIDRFIELDFLGEKARFPEGPFSLIAALKVPVLAVAAHYETPPSQGFGITWEEFEVDENLPRDQRILQIGAQYVRFLSNLCQTYPEQFFNFHDMWEQKRDPAA